MLSIHDGASLAHVITLPIDPRLKALLALRREQLGPDSDIGALARFIIVQPDDSLDAIESELSFSPLQNPVDGARFDEPDFVPGWEWIEEHSGWFELVFLLSDDGFAWVLLVPDDPGIHPDLLRLCHDHS